MSQLLLLNPKARSKRKTSAKRKPRRTAAQRAATARMLAANRSRRSVSHNPAPRRSRRKPYRRNPIGRARRSVAMIGNSGAMGLLKSGVAAGVGAVGVDIAFGQISRFLPASMATPLDATGGTNWLYFVAKFGVAVGVAYVGRKTRFRKFTDAAAVGSATIMAYQITRSMLPASVALGAYVNPGRVMQPASGMNGLNAYVGRSLPNMPASATGGTGASAAMTAQRMAVAR